MTIKSLTDFYDTGLPVKQYYDQFKTARKLIVGNIYRQDSGVFYIDYRIVYIGYGVALGIEVGNGNNNFNINNKTLFNVGGNLAGWKVNDNRYNYRLIEDVTGLYNHE